MPITPTYPGIYVQEIASGVRTITGVSTSVTAFVGQARYGSINQATHILSYTDYERNFGGVAGYSEMSYAVSQFFLNGGSDAWIVRLVGAATTPDSVILQDGETPAQNVLKIASLTPGESTRSIQVLVDYPASPAGAFTFTFISTAKDNPADQITETFNGLSMDRNAANYVVKQVNGASQLVTVDDSVQSAAVQANNNFAQIRPVVSIDHGSLTSGAIQPADISGLPSASVNSLRISLDGSSPETITLDHKTAATGLADIATRLQNAVQQLKPADPAYQNFTCSVVNSNQLVLSSGTLGTGSSVQVRAAASNSIGAALHLLTDATPAAPSTFLLTGGAGGAFVAGEEYNLFIADRSKRQGIYAMEEVDLFNILCLPGITDGGILAAAIAYCEERGAFMIVDSPSGLTPDQMYTTMTAATSVIPKSDHGAIYYPWIKITDPLNPNTLRLSAPCGTVAGIYARTDSTRGVWKAPAGTEASLLGIQGAETILTDAQNGILNPNAVNCLRLFPVYGPVVWGSRTLIGSGQDYTYVPVRRLALYIEESLYQGTKWVVFEPNDEKLWAQIRLNIGAFMHTLFRQGAFQGQTPSDAYLVKCDSETTTQDDINHGIVNILVGFAPLKPAEFVIITIQQLAGQIAV